LKERQELATGYRKDKDCEQGKGGKGGGGSRRREEKKNQEIGTPDPAKNNIQLKSLPSHTRGSAEEDQGNRGKRKGRFPF